MKLRDKIILVTYFPVGGVDEGDVNSYVSEFAEEIKGIMDDSVEHIIIPVKDSVDYKVECINPVLLDSERYSEVEGIVDRFKERAKEFLK